METLMFIFFIAIFALTIFDIFLLVSYYFIIKKNEEEDEKYNEEDNEEYVEDDDEDDEYISHITDISYITDLLSTICVCGWLIIFYYVCC
jgi:regulatory protein YycI of two-component signal transduction system YycFG